MDPEARRQSFAAVWRVGDAAPHGGKLQLDADALVLSGAHAPAGLRIAFDDLASVRIGRRPEERIDGVASLVLERKSDERVLAYIFGSVGALGELFEFLSTIVVGAF